MKKYISYLAMVLCAVALLSSCSNDTENEQLQEQENVKVTFIYTLDTSNGGSMSRAITNAEVFNEFYAKITSGELVAPSYNLTLTEVTTGAVYTFNGKWDSHDLVTLRTGTYNVVGESKAEGENIQDKCSFTFNEQIEINAESSTITLHANYDCFLLIFNNSQIESLENYNGSVQSSFYTFETYKYAFVNDKLFIEEQKNNAYILGKYTDNAEFKIFTGNLKFEKGKYYVYNSVSNGFDVPPMEEGGNTQATDNREIEGFGRIADAIDLGLSVKWASWNVGASNIADYGGLYGAGDPTGLLTSTNYSLYYYNYGECICGTEYDIATVKWQENWRMPTMEELDELKDKCQWEHNVNNEGIYGSIAIGPNGNSIFFPYAGNSHGGKEPGRDEIASIWSGDCGIYPYAHGYKDLDIFKDGKFQTDGSENWVAQSVRPVCDYENQ